MLAGERQRDLIRLGESLHAPRERQAEFGQAMENRFVGPAKAAISEPQAPQALPREPVVSCPPRHSEVRARRRRAELAGHRQAATGEPATRELDRV